jgi:hypothetical protein
MLIERQVSIFLTGVAVAVVLPEYTDMRQHPDYAPHAALLIGTLIGALGTFMGAAVAADNEPPWFGWLLMSVWMAIAAGFGLTAGMGALHSPGLVWQGVFGLCALLCVAGPGFVLWRKWLDSRPGRPG